MLNLLRRKPPPSPRLEHGCLSDAAARGFAQKRLERFLALEVHFPALNEHGRWLVRRSQYSAYSQMVRLGAVAQARYLVQSAEIAREIAK